jgi:hypothetical protein
LVKKDFIAGAGRSCLADKVLKLLKYRAKATTFENPKLAEAQVANKKTGVCGRKATVNGGSRRESNESLFLA